MRRDPEPCAPFAHEGARLANIEALQRSQASVHDLETVPGDAAAEVLPFDEGHPEPTPSRVSCDTGADDAAADDQDVVRGVRQRIREPSHAASYHLPGRAEPGATAARALPLVFVMSCDSFGRRPQGGA
jgi:hypothetical protein